MALEARVKRWSIPFYRLYVGRLRADCNERIDFAGRAAGSGGPPLPRLPFTQRKATFPKVSHTFGSEVPHDSGRQAAHFVDRRSGIDPR